MNTQPKNIKDKGLVPNDDRTKDYILYSRGDAWTPQRFYDYILININRPYDHNRIIKEGFILADINQVISRFEGISFDYLGN